MLTCCIVLRRGQTQDYGADFVINTWPGVLPRTPFVIIIYASVHTLKILREEFSDSLEAHNVVRNIGRYILFIVVVKYESRLLNDKTNKNGLFLISYLKKKVVQNNRLPQRRNTTFALHIFQRPGARFPQISFEFPLCSITFIVQLWCVFCLDWGWSRKKHLFFAVEGCKSRSVPGAVQPPSSPIVQQTVSEEKWTSIMSSI